MSKEEKRAPEVRFEGFHDDWKQRKLDKLAYFSKGSGYSKKDLIPYGYPIILYGRLYTKYETVIQNVDTYVNKKEKSIISNGNEVIVPASGESAEDISRASVVANSGMILGGDLNIITLKEKIEPVFLALTISNGKQKKELRKRAQGKSVVHLHNSDLKEVNLICPSKEEQKKISELFRTLENSITLHQEKLSKLQSLKEAALQSLFPQKDETEPKVRFANFKSKWSQRQLGETLIERNIQQTQSIEYPLVSFTVQDGVTPKTERYNRQQLVRGSKKDKKYKVTEFNDIVYNPANLKFGAIARNKYGKAVLSPIYVTFRVNQEIVYPSYIEMTVTNPDFIKYSLRYQQGTVYERQSVNPEDLLSLYISIPEKEEQSDIGLFFEQLNNDVELYKSKLEKLQRLKKSFLQRMFI